MDGLEELVSHLSGSSRAIVIAERYLDLRAQGTENTLFLLKIGEGSSAAGGRGGGFGERKVTEVLCFRKQGGAWAKVFQTTDEERLADFEVPYYVSRLPFTQTDGTESIGYGVVDPDLVGQMSAKAGISSPA